MPLPALDAELDQAYDTVRLADQTDPAAYLAREGHRFEAVATSAMVGISAEQVAALPKLRMVSSFGVGLDKLDQASLVARGVAVGYTAGVLDGCVADMAMALWLGTARQVAAADRFVRAGQWSQARYPLTQRVHGKRVGILGMGRIGQAVARRAQGFEVQLGYHNRSPVAGSPHLYWPNLLAMAEWADVLVVTVDGGAQAHHLVNEAVLRALGQQGLLVNVARGRVVDEAALVRVLAEGALGGAGLDVFEDEPAVPDALKTMDNVLLQPHAASGTHETRRGMADLVLENLDHFFSTGQPRCAVPWARSPA
jgi:lactate dehydrogenase-like 2-hydroxyacid dehydrogenase